MVNQSFISFDITSWLMTVIPRLSCSLVQDFYAKFATGGNDVVPKVKTCAYVVDEYVQEKQSVHRYYGYTSISPHSYAGDSTPVPAHLPACNLEGFGS